MRRAQPGDTLVMQAGQWADQKIVFSGNGAPGKPITLRPHTAGAVKLTRGSQLKISGSHLVVEGLWLDQVTTPADLIEFRTRSSTVATNCVLRHVALTDCQPAPPSTETRWVSLYGVSNVVEFCHLSGKRNRGPTLVVWLDTNQPNYHLIRSNYFGPREPLGKNGGETIRVGDSATSPFNSRTTVEGNLFERCNGEVEIISNKSCENRYLHNTFRECEGALTFRHGQRCWAEGNFFLGNGKPHTGGIRLVDADHVVINNYFADLTGSEARSTLTLMNGLHRSPLNGYFQVRNALIAFNTFVNCTHTMLIGQSDGGGRLAPVNCTLANNLVQGSRSPLIKLATVPTNFVWEGNLFSGASPGPTLPGNRVAEAKLQRAADGLWRPAPGSPALGGAVGAYPQINADMEGQPRPKVGADVGADQLSTTPATRRPLLPGDVGPGWWRVSRSQKP